MIDIATHFLNYTIAAFSIAVMGFALFTAWCYVKVWTISFGGWIFKVRMTWLRWRGNRTNKKMIRTLDRIDHLLDQNKPSATKG